MLLELSPGKIRSGCSVSFERKLGVSKTEQ